MTEDVMPTTERERVILAFLDESDVAFPLRPLFFNLKRKKNITFSRSTLRRRVNALVDQGFVRRINEGNGYYEITDKGRAYLAGDLDAGDEEE